MFSELFAAPERPANTAQFVFLNAKSPELFVDWDSVADVIGVLLPTPNAGVAAPPPDSIPAAPSGDQV